ncbi:hypothetical protein Ancab_008372 [Ancistrocladus abbreviatus]
MVEVFEPDPVSSYSINVVPENKEEAINTGKQFTVKSPWETNPVVITINPGINVPTSNMQEKPKRNDEKGSDIVGDNRRSRREKGSWDGGEKLMVSADKVENQRSKTDITLANVEAGLDKWADNIEGMGCSMETRARPNDINELGIMGNISEEEVTCRIEGMEKRDAGLFA